MLSSGARVMKCSLRSDVGVWSSPSHWGAGMYILFIRSMTPQELFHQVGDAQSVLGRSRLKMESLATENVIA